jgi:hypothetical protein
MDSGRPLHLRIWAGLRCPLSHLPGTRGPTSRGGLRACGVKRRGRRLPAAPALPRRLPRHHEELVEHGMADVTLELDPFGVKHTCPEFGGQLRANLQQQPLTDARVTNHQQCPAVEGGMLDELAHAHTSLASTDHVGEGHGEPAGR